MEYFADTTKNENLWTNTQWLPRYTVKWKSKGLKKHLSYATLKKIDFVAFHVKKKGK